VNRAEALIDLGAVEVNVKRILASTRAAGLAVVKADAYGHGLVPVAKRALEAGASWLGTALLEEALKLRNEGVTAPIIAWLTPINDDFEGAITSNIDLAIPSLAHLEAISRAAIGLGKSARVHLEVDTGMSRGGALREWNDLCKSASKLVSEKRIEVIGIWSHFARADEPGHTFNEEQLRNFQARVSEAKSLGINPPILHLSNSAATLTNPKSHFDLVRLGISMYGLSPDIETMGDSKKLDLFPVMSLRSQVHLVKDVPAGSQVGYGGTALTINDTKLAVIPMGYADGIPRNADSSTGVLVGNRKAPIIGRVSMDQFVVDLGNDSIARAGEWAYLIGSEGSDGYTADAWAKASGTINYEIVTRIGARVPRIFKN
jgi:alanine racemase